MNRDKYITRTIFLVGQEQRIWKMPPSPTRKRDRSKTFDGIAQAVVMQWANAALTGDGAVPVESTVMQED